MKNCEQCGNEFKNKRESARFCSDSCRVKWNRKNPKKDAIKPFQMQVLYNEMVELISEMKVKLQEQPIVFDSPPKPTNYFNDEPKQWAEPKKEFKIKRTFENYQQLRIDCENEDEWLKLKEDILNVDHLSQKQKALLTN